MINELGLPETEDGSVEQSIERNKKTLQDLCSKLYDAFDNPVVTEHYPVTTVAAEYLPEEERPQSLTVDIDGVNYVVVRIREPRGPFAKGVDINHVQVAADGTFNAIGTIVGLQSRNSWLTESDNHLEGNDLQVQQQDKLISVAQALLTALGVSETTPQ